MSFRSNLKKFGRLYPKEVIWMENLEPKKPPPLVPKIDLAECDDCIIYGIGNGEVYTSLKPWLKKKRNRLLIFVEPELAVLKAFLETPLASEMLKESKVQLHYFVPGEENEVLLRRLMWNGFSRRTAIIKDPRIDEEDFISFKNRVQFDEDRMKWFGYEFITYAVLYFLNFYRNLKMLPKSFKGGALMGKAKGVPAYIVGAGPSLNKNGALLKTVGRKGLIFGGGSALPAMQRMGIEPDFAAGLDPNIWHLERLKACKNTRFPFFYRFRINADALEMVEGAPLFLPGSSLYDTPAWVESKLGIESVDLEEGHNVINFLTDIAVHMGCNPIIYVGLDLAYTDSKSYAEGIFVPPPAPTDIVHVDDIYGQPIISRWLWLKESMWLSEFALAHSDVQFINATEGGVGIKKVPNEKLQAVVNSHTKETVKPDLFQFEPLGVKEEQIGPVMEELRESLSRVDKIFAEMEKVYSALDPKTFTGHIPEEPLWGLQLQEEPSFEAIIAIYDEFCLHRISNSQLFYLIQRDGMNAKKAEKVIDCQLERLKYLRKVIQIQLEMILSINTTV